jgi:hypothetical protein
MQVNVKVRLLQLDQVVLEIEKAAMPPAIAPPTQEEPVVYIPPPTTDVQTIELWYEREAGEYGVPRTTF